MRGLLARGVPETARPFGGLVYRQALEHLHGVRDEAATRALIAQENRRYARRQLIWFRKEPNLDWFDGPGESPATVAAVEPRCSTNGCKASQLTSRRPRPHHASSSSCSTASASASCPMPRAYGDRAATRSATSRSRCRCACRRCASLGLGARRRASAAPRRRRRVGACRPHGRGVAGQGLGHRPLGDDGHRPRPPVPGVSARLPGRTSSPSSRAAPAAACSATWRRRARRSSTSSAPSTCAPARSIVYTSADSVFQIAAHEDVVPVPELYRACEIAYELVGEGLGVGRVIARPFVGAPGRVHADREPPRLRAAAVRRDAARPR